MMAYHMNSTWQMRANQPSASDSPSLHDAGRYLSPLGGCVDLPATHTSTTPSLLDTVKAFRCCGSVLGTQTDQDGSHQVALILCLSMNCVPNGRFEHGPSVLISLRPAATPSAWGRPVIGNRQTWHTGAGPAPPIGPTPLFPTHDGVPPNHMAARALDDLFHISTK